MTSNTNDYTESLLDKSSNKGNYNSLANNTSPIATNTNSNSNPVQQQQNEMNKEFPNKNEDNKMEEEYEYKLNQQQHSINSGSIHQYNDSQAALIQRQDSDDQAIQKQSTAISMSNGQQPTNMNVISALKEKASSNKTKARVDNVFLYSSIPKLGDLFMDHQTSAITLLHFGFALLTIILIIIGYVMDISVVWKYGTFLCLITNLFGITHSMYSGSISNKLTRLDAALQNFALIIQKFAKALNIQEAYLSSVKNILDFLDHHILLIQYEHPEIENIMKQSIDNDSNDDNVDYKHLAKIYYQFVEKLKHQTTIQHKKWLLTFFGQYKLLDNRFGITKLEYLDFIHKLPNKSRTFFQSLTGVHTRFKELDHSDELNQPPPSSYAHSSNSYQPPTQPPTQQEEKGYDAEIIDNEKKRKHSKEPIPLDERNNNNKYLRKPSIGMDMASYRTTSVLDSELGDDTVLLYKDMTELVYKVLEDISIVNKRIQSELAEKMIHRERQNEEMKRDREQRAMSPSNQQQLIPQGYILSQRMSVSLARDAPNMKIGNHKKPKMINSDKGKTTISISSAFTNEEDATAYRKMKYDTDNESDDDVYNVNNIDKDRSNTLPITNINIGNKSSSMRHTAISDKSSIESALRKMKSYDSEMYTAVDFVKQRTLSMDEDWLKKVMNDLNDDDQSAYYDYSHSHKL